MRGCFWLPLHPAMQQAMTALFTEYPWRACAPLGAATSAFMMSVYVFVLVVIAAIISDGCLCRLESCFGRPQRSLLHEAAEACAEQKGRAHQRAHEAQHSKHKTQCFSYVDELCVCSCLASLHVTSGGVC